MKFGVSMFTTDRSAGPAETACEAEARGFESFWVSEHSHIPVASAPPFDGFDTRTYAAMLDPFVALAAAANATSTIRLGTAVCLVTQHDPINCAKAVATLDQISKGRFLFGVGAGWNVEEMRNHGTDPDTRFRLMRERVEAMRAIWTHDEASYHGRLVDFAPIRCWPKPVQRPGPPVLIGGAGPGVLRRTVAYGDGWLPVVTPVLPPGMSGRMVGLDELDANIAELGRLARDARRTVPTVSVTGLTPEPAQVERLENLGVERMILRLAPAPIDSVRRELDSHLSAVRAAGAALQSA